MLTPHRIMLAVSERFPGTTGTAAVGLSGWAYAEQGMQRVTTVATCIGAITGAVVGIYSVVGMIRKRRKGGNQ